MDIKQFLNSSYTAYHTTQNVCSILKQHGFVQLTLGQRWDICRGGKYFVTRNGSSVIAFTVGKNNVFAMCESHTDSPSFKIKGCGVVASDGVSRLNTEKYGGGLLYTYFDRPLKVAGRVLVKENGQLKQVVVTSNYNVVIPSLAIHLNREANEKFTVRPQIDTLPLFAQGEQALYESLVQGEVVDADLYVVPASQSFNAGVQNEFLCSARIDNLTSVYTSVMALCNSKGENINFAVCLDNEEIGSGTRQGSPTFISQVVENLCFALGMDTTARNFALENGMVLSVDNCHSTHPAHTDKCDIMYKTYLNKGIAIKHHVNYATDGLSSAIFKNVLQQADLPFQDLYNRSDLSGGRTLGLVTSSELGIKTCDIGIPQLAMHSACETCGAQDVETMQKGLTAFYNCPQNAFEVKE